LAAALGMGRRGIGARVKARPVERPHGFYLARSYDDLAKALPGAARAGGWRQKAEARYRQRSTMGGYIEEVFFSLYRLGVLRLAEGDGLALLMEAWQRQPQRWEPVYEAARWLNRRGLYQASYALSKQALARAPAAPSGVFVYPDVYDHSLLFEHSISAHYVGQYQESWDACQMLLGKRLPAHTEEAVRRNMVFPRRELDKRAP